MLAACAIGSVAGRVALFLIASRVGHLLIARKCAHLYSSSRINFCIVLDSSPPPSALLIHSWCRKHRQRSSCSRRTGSTAPCATWKTGGTARRRCATVLALAPKGPSARRRSPICPTTPPRSWRAAGWVSCSARMRLVTPIRRPWPRTEGRISSRQRSWSSTSRSARGGRSNNEDGKMVKGRLFH